MKAIILILILGIILYIGLIHTIGTFKNPQCTQTENLFHIFDYVILDFESNCE